MTLASPVTDRMGRLLIPAGAALSARHVGALTTWGVDQIEIVSEAPAPAPVEITPEIEARARAEVRARFRHAGGSHPFLDHLTEIAVGRRSRWLAAGGAGPTVWAPAGGNGDGPGATPVGGPPV